MTKARNLLHLLTRLKKNENAITGTGDAFHEYLRMENHFYLFYFRKTLQHLLDTILAFSQERSPQFVTVDIRLHREERMRFEAERAIGKIRYGIAIGDIRRYRFEFHPL